MTKKVTVYSTPTCPYCVQVKEYLNGKNIKYDHFDVSVDQEKAQEMVKKTGQMGVPVLIISDGKDEEIVIGFDKGKIDKELGISS